MAPLTDPRSSRTKEACARPPLSSASQLAAAQAPAEVCAENTLREMQGQGQGHTERAQRRPGQDPALPEHETPRARVPTGLGPGAAWAGHTLRGAGLGLPPGPQEDRGLKGAEGLQQGREGRAGGWRPTATNQLQLEAKKEE